MDVSQPASFWSVLLPVLAGGALTICGGVTAPIVSHFLTSRSAREAKRTERLEALLTAINEHDHWLEQKKRLLVFGEQIELGPPPLARAIALASIHFPSLLPALRKLDVDGTNYELWMGNEAVRRANGEWTPHAEDFNKSYTPYRTEYLDFATKISQFAAKNRTRKPPFMSKVLHFLKLGKTS